MDVCKSNDEHFVLRLSQLKVQWNTIGLEASVASALIFASCQQWMSLVLNCTFLRTVLYPSQRKT